MKKLELFKSLQGKQISFFAIGMQRANKLFYKLHSLGAGEFVITMAVNIKYPIADTNEIKQTLTNLK